MGIRREVEDAVYRYAWACDEDDIDAIVACFTQTGVFATNTGAPPCVGPAALAELFGGARKRRSDAGQRTRHVMTNVLVDDRHARVTARSYLTLFTTPLGGATFVECSGEYRDVLVRESGRWRFAERTVTFDAIPSSLSR
jgi:3-phenylpropionate/cinnamic acid dioxygenase small subunit